MPFSPRFDRVSQCASDVFERMSDAVASTWQAAAAALINDSRCDGQEVLEHLLGYEDLYLDPLLPGRLLALAPALYCSEGHLVQQLVGRALARVHNAAPGGWETLDVLFDQHALATRTDLGPSSNLTSMSLLESAWHANRAFLIHKQHDHTHAWLSVYLDKLIAHGGTFQTAPMHADAVTIVARQLGPDENPSLLYVLLDRGLSYATCMDDSLVTPATCDVIRAHPAFRRDALSRTAHDHSSENLVRPSPPKSKF
jgi:hypothetical protein